MAWLASVKPDYELRQKAKLEIFVTRPETQDKLVKLSRATERMADYAALCADVTRAQDAHEKATRKLVDFGDVKELQRTIQTLYNDIYGQDVSSTGSGTS